MKLKHYAIFIFIFIFCIASCKTEWKTDATQITEEIGKAKKNGLMLFTLSDTDERSKQLLSEVFTKDFFKTASSKFLLYNINIVRNENLMPAKILEKNYTLFSKYNVLEVPHICLMNSQGDLFHSELIPADIKTTESFLEYLEKLLQKGELIDELKKNIAATENEEKTKAIYKFFEKIYLVNSEKYNALFEEGIKSDPNNKSGLLGKFILAKTQIVVDKLLNEKNYADAINEFKKVIEMKILTPEEEQATWCNIAYFTTASSKPNKEEVIKYLEKALSAAPKSARAKDIKKDIEYLKK